VAKRKDHAAAMPALVHDVMAVLERHAPAVFARKAELSLTDQWLQAVTEGAAKALERPKGSLHAPSLLDRARFFGAEGRAPAGLPAQRVRQRRPGRPAVRVHQAERF